MIRVSVEVRGAGMRSEVPVGAESIESALSLARARYPSSEVSVVFPIAPEDFFVPDGAPLPVAAHPVAPGAPEQAV